VIAVLIDVNATATLLGHQWHNIAEFHENVTVTEKETCMLTL
jgi:hypothetical protein